MILAVLEGPGFQGLGGRASEFIYIYIYIYIYLSISIYLFICLFIIYLFVYSHLFTFFSVLSPFTP